MITSFSFSLWQLLMEFCLRFLASCIDFVLKTCVAPRACAGSSQPASQREGSSCLTARVNHSLAWKQRGMYRSYTATYKQSWHTARQNLRKINRKAYNARHLKSVGQWCLIPPWNELYSASVLKHLHCLPCMCLLLIKFHCYRIEAWVCLYIPTADTIVQTLM